MALAEASSEGDVARLHRLRRASGADAQPPDTGSVSTPSERPPTCQWRP